MRGNNSSGGGRRGTRPTLRQMVVMGRVQDSVCGCACECVSMCARVCVLDLIPKEADPK